MWAGAEWAAGAQERCQDALEGAGVHEPEATAVWEVDEQRCIRLPDGVCASGDELSPGHLPSLPQATGMAYSPDAL